LAVALKVGNDHFKGPEIKLVVDAPEIAEADVFVIDSKFVDVVVNTPLVNVVVPATVKG
jgi:hypothetical protein